MLSKRIIASFLYLILIGSLIFGHILYSNPLELMNLNMTLNSLENISGKYALGLVGQSLVGKKFKDIFTQDQLNSVTPKLKGDDLVLHKYDSDQKIYQLTVLRQHETTCGAHTLKNSLWMINGLMGTMDNFLKNYLKTLDETVFENYYSLLSNKCKRDGFVRFADQKREIRESALSCLGTCLPKYSANYLDQLFSFTYAPKGNPLYYPMHIGFVWNDNVKKARERFKKIEPLADLDRVTRDVGIFFPDFPENDFMKFYNQIIKNSYCLGIYLSVDNGSMGHATSLIIHKIKNKVEYLFLDSMNWPFDGQYPYMPLIESVKSFAENPENFKNALIRWAYNQTLTYIEDHKVKPSRAFDFGLNIFLNDMFKDLNLMQTELYKNVYKPHFCKLIKDSIESEFKQVLNDESKNKLKDKYENILRKMDCSS